MTEWIASNALTLILVSVTAIGAWYTFGARLSNVEKDQELRRGQHKEHYEATRRIETAAAAFDQKLTSHIADDQRQIDTVMELLREQREDTKDILKHLRNGGSK